MRNFCVLAVIVFLSACASVSQDPPIAKIQNVVYRVGDQPPLVPASAKSDEAGAGTGSSKPMHVYWFLSGR